MAKLNSQDIKVIIYDFENKEMKIFNKKDLLVFEETVSEEIFNKSVGKWKREELK